MKPSEIDKNVWGFFNLYPQAAAVTDMKMARFININDKFCELTQFSREEIFGSTTTELGLFTEEDRKRLIHELIIYGEINGLDNNLKRKDNSVAPTRMFSRLITNGRERFVLSIFYHLAEAKRVEFQTQEKEKNRAIRTLVGGIAHEFNNALAGISGNAELLELELADNKGVMRYVEAIRVSIRRMTKIMDQLIAYAREGRYQEETISLNSLIDEILLDLTQVIAPSINLATDLPKNIPHVKADRTQMQMVLSGILNNASEALDGAGKIRISTREEMIDEGSVKTKPELEPGRYICLTVEDDGQGMAEETIKRIFDPFFTTKFHGRGLGMAAAYGIVRNHGGGIYVDSELGKGTKVHIYLPAIDAETKALVKPAEKITGGRGTILVAEDEDAVLDVSRKMLKRLGFQVLEARTGKEAVHIANDFDVDIDLAILDIKLPDMDGSEVYPLIKKARPNLRVIIWSGFDINGPARKILVAGAQGFIQKPFTFETLSAKLKDLIDRRRDNRFKVVRGAVAIPKNDASDQGQIIDVSRGGLSFAYHESEDLKKEFAELAISLASEGFFLDRIPCKVISYDPPRDSVPFHHAKVARVGVQLGKLTQTQTDQFEYFIQNYTTGQA